MKITKFRYYLLIFLPGCMGAIGLWMLIDYLFNMESPSWIYLAASITGLVFVELRLWPEYKLKYNLSVDV